MHEAGLCPVFVSHELHETNQAVFEERSDEDAPLQESRFYSAYGLQILPVVPEPFALSDRRLVINGVYTPNESIVERHLPGDYPGFGRFPDLVPDLEVNLMCHPMLKG